MPSPAAFHRGIYSLTASGATPSAKALTNPYVAGIVIRTSWGSIETSEGRYDWSYLDTQIQAAKKSGKRLAIHIKAGSTQSDALPAWLRANPKLQLFSYFRDGAKITVAAPWDPIYLEKLTSFIRAVGNRYRNESTIAYLRLGGGQSILSGWEASRELYDASGSNRISWQEAGFRQDRLFDASKQTIDAFAEALPSTVLWDEPETVEAWQDIPGMTNKTSASKVITAYGLSRPNYGVWREDLHACTATNPPPGQSSYLDLFKILWSAPGRDGAQMVWNVQDGTQDIPSSFRMNPKNCVSDEDGDSDVDQADVLRKALDTALAYGMPYVEVYQADVADPDLQQTLSYAASQFRK